MAISSAKGSPKAPTLPLPSPKAPPGYPDLYGKRREISRLHMLEREISFLEEELKSSEGFQPASRCCKEIDDFVMAKADPLLPTLYVHVASPALPCAPASAAVAAANPGVATAANVSHQPPIVAAVRNLAAAKVAVGARIAAFHQVAIHVLAFLAAVASVLALALALPAQRFHRVVVVQIQSHVGIPAAVILASN
ncbi:hypothetical protein Ahy_B03g065348 [Arachis hypogaea]|uniref:G protein gamma domain-containing protein n=1 Tax=Arachis hypogaea TaxID=3818 RepID=A0A445A1F2_ARAHY|nr:hypothetical protein Ahy_B03g065348 [Arachis hypogaea]